MNKKVLLFLAQGFEEYEASVYTDVIGWSRIFGTEPVDLITTGLRPEIKGTWNLIVRPEIGFEKIKTKDIDALAIPGEFDKEGKNSSVNLCSCIANWKIRDSKKQKCNNV